MKKYTFIVFVFFILKSQTIFGQKQECEEYILYKKAIEYAMNKMEDTVVVQLNNPPNQVFIGDWKNKGLINSKEKRKIELAYEKSTSVICAETKNLLNSLNSVKRAMKGSSYMKYLFSKPVVISKTRAIVFSETILKSKEYASGGKAIGCNTVFLFSNESGAWEVYDKICLEMT